MPLIEVDFHEDNGPVGSGGSGSRFATATDGSKWILKSTYFGGQQHRYLYLNEALGALVAEEIGAPVPQAAVMRLTLEQARAFKVDANAAECVLFASERIDPCEPLSDEAVDGAAVPALASIVVLDQLIWNTDRQQKPEHVLARKRPDEAWDVWAVDHGHCFCVAHSLNDADLAPDRVAQPPWNWLTRRVSRADLEPLVEKATEVGAERYGALVGELPAEWVVETDTQKRLGDALARRAEALDGVLYPLFPDV